MKHAIAGGLLLLASAPQSVDLGTAKLRPVNREVSRAAERAGVHLSAKDAPGVAWIEGSDFREGTIEVDVRGKDVLQQSFLGVAFHRKDDQTYESVYLRPFNFQATDPARHKHAIQYMQVPEFDWPILREKFPEEFERPVDGSVTPTDWVHLKVVVKGERVQAFVGSVTTPTLEVRKLGRLGSGMVGLWVGNNSDGDFANLTIRGAKPLG
jgi:hypothetical protein